MKKGGGGGVLDIGCGNGVYGHFLAKEFPYVKFYGIEKHSDLIRKTQERQIKVNNYAVFECDLNTHLLPDDVAGQFNQCLLRLVLQHCSDPFKIIKKVYDSLPEGGRIFVIEEDDDFFKMYPDCKAFNDVVKIWKTVCEAEGTERYMGTKCQYC